MTSLDEKYSILIDTNVMMLFLLLNETCIFLGKNFCEVTAEELTSLSKRPGVNGRGINNHVKKALKYFEYIKNLKDSQKDNLIIYFSSFSEYELIHSLVELEIREELANQGIHHRFQEKLPFILQEEFDCVKDVRKTWQNFKVTLENQDIYLKYPEEEDQDSHHHVINEVTHLVNEYVVLESQDLYLYSLSIYMRVDEILTKDENFSNIIKSLQSGSSIAKGDKIVEDLCNTYDHYYSEKDLKNGLNHRVLPKCGTV